MTVLNNADKIMLGSSVVSHVYLGANPVWPVAQQKHAYWRVYITANNGGNYTAVQEMEMRATAGGMDQCVGGSAFASDSFYAYPPHGSGAFDGDLTDYTKSWLTSISLPASVGYAFAAPVQVSELVMWPQNYANVQNRSPKDFALERSADDGITWTTQKQFTGITGWVMGQSKTFTI